MPSRKIVFFIFILEKDICYDSLTISGITEKEFCGSRPTPAYTADSNVVEIHMESDDSTELSGFDISFTSVLSKQH